MADGSVIIDIKGDSSAFQKTLGGLGSLAGGALKGVGTAVGAATAAVGGLAAAAIKVGSGFESSMSQVAATMGITTDEIANGSASSCSVRRPRMPALRPRFPLHRPPRRSTTSPSPVTTPRRRRTLCPLS